MAFSFCVFLIGRIENMSHMRTHKLQVADYVTEVAGSSDKW